MSRLVLVTLALTVLLSSSARASEVGLRWSELVPGGPIMEGRSGHVAVYDSARDRMIVYAGWNPSHLHLDTWAVNFGDNPTWMLIPAAPVPPGRLSASAIYDPVRDRMIVFGGSTGGFEPVLLNDTWALTLSGTPAWTELHPAGTAPSPRRLHSAIYDPIHDRMIIYGGSTGESLASDEAWCLSLGENPGWTRLVAGGTAPHREMQAVVHDPLRNRMIVSGGFNGYDECPDETWALSLGASPAWSLIADGRQRWGHLIYHDTASDRLIIHGGLDYMTEEASEETWGIRLGSGQGWGRLLPAGNIPLARLNASGICDSKRGRLVMFGGDALNGCDYRSDIWILDPGSTTSVPASTPVAAQDLRLEAPQPNPAGEVTRFRFALPRASAARLEIFDPTGRRVALVHEGMLAAGAHEVSWSPGTDGGRALAPGVYMVRLQVEGRAVGRKIVVR